jgi:RecA-family ATPase
LKLKPGETKAMYSNGILVGKWKDKWDVMYISTEFKNNSILAKIKKVTKN